MIACVSAWDVRDAPNWDDLLAECAIYAAASRQPWSEPPITDPPALADDQRGDIGELREAVAAGDRLRGERWLAKRMNDADFLSDFFAVARDDYEDLGHKLIIAVNAWRLSVMFPPYPTLRTAVWEMTAYRGNAKPPVRADVVEAMIANRGDIESAHAVFYYDAALQTRVEHPSPGPAAPAERPVRGIEPYRLARDCGAYLKSFAVAKRLGDARIVDAAKYNLDHAPSLEDFSFA
ncbi:MAG TPA: hypothetical protein VI391_02555 [Thermoanaerobaculia bacterium]